MLEKSKARKVREKDDRFSDRNRRIFDFLNGTRVGVLSTTKPDGDPHGVVIYFNVEPSFRITFLTRAETQKYDNLKHHDHVMLSVFELSTQTTVQIAGRAIELTDGREVNKAADGMLSASLQISDPGLAPISKLEAGQFVAFEIRPVQIRMAVYARPDTGNYSELFESIESFESA